MCDYKQSEGLIEPARFGRAVDEHVVSAQRYRVSVSVSVSRDFEQKNFLLFHISAQGIDGKSKCHVCPCGRFERKGGHVLSYTNWAFVFHKQTKKFTEILDTEKHTRSGQL